MKNTSDILYKKLIEHMNEAVWMGDEKERTIYANPKFCQLVEYTLEEIIGKESYMFWDEHSAQTVKSVNSKDRKKGVSSSYEGILVTKKGKKIPVLLSGTPLPDGGTIGIMTDITAQKQKEEIHGLYKKLLDHMDEAVCMEDALGKIIFVNEQFCHLIEKSQEEVLGTFSYEYVDTPTAKKLQLEKDHRRKKGESSRYEGNLVNTHEKKIPVYISGTSLPDGGTIGIMTDLRKVKEKEKSERVLLLAVEYASDGMIMFDAAGHITAWNQGARNLFGYKKENIVGSSINKIFSQTIVDNFLSEKEKIDRFELEAVDKHGKIRNISTTLTVIPQQDGIISYMIICRDISEIKKFEQEINLKYIKIKEVYEQIGVLKRETDYIFDLLDIFGKYFYDIQSIGDFIVTSIIMLTKVDACVLRMYDKKKNQLEMISNFGLSEGWQGKKIIKMEGSLLEQAIAQGVPLKILDVRNNMRYQSLNLARKNNLVSLLLIPLKHRGKPIGSISLYTTFDKKFEILENAFIEKYAKVIELVFGASLQNQDYK